MANSTTEELLFSIEKRLYFLIFIFFLLVVLFVITMTVFFPPERNLDLFFIVVNFLVMTAGMFFLNKALDKLNKDLEFLIDQF